MGTANISYGPKLGLLNNAAIGQTYYDPLRLFLQKIDAIVSASVVNSTTVVPPTSPSNGDTYLVPASGGSGAWNGFANNVAYWDAQYTTSGTNTLAPQWILLAPVTGWLVYNIATAQFLYWNGTAWTAFGISIPLPVASGGTGATTAPAALTSLGAAASGENSDITGLSAIGSSGIQSTGVINAGGTTIGGGGMYTGGGITGGNLNISGTAGFANVNNNNPGGTITVTQAGGANYAMVFASGISITEAYSGYGLTLAGFTAATSATAGSASTLPATPVGYLEVSINGSSAKIPFYAT